MADITAIGTTSVPYTTGVPNPTIDDINTAIQQAALAIIEINLAGGDGMADRIPDNSDVADVFSDAKAGAKVWGADSSTNGTVTTSFTADKVFLSDNLGPASGAWATISGTTITIHRTVTTNSQTTFYLAVQSD